MTAAEIASALGGAHRSGDGWAARCPAHQDRRPSLSLTERDGRLLVHCHAGCEQAAVIDALRGRGLWPDRSNRNHEWLTWRDDIRYPADWGRIVREYIYHDVEGRPLYSVFRLDPKSFRQGYRAPSGKWIWRKHPKQVPYRLPEVLLAEIIFVTEGEKDVETLREWGFAATCNAGGAGKWRADWGPLFARKTVIILPDNDEPGLAHARQVAAALLPHAAQMAIINLPGAKDVSDWFAAGHSELELCALVDGALAPWEQEVQDAA
ncbi:MAG TPA: hypothetical protein PLP04_15670 [Bryobacteraceae bacterium]|nr:hypothetical protein [Bryobacteraceae bacterium]